MLEIQSWFGNKDQLAVMATSMAKYLQQSEKAATLPEGVAGEYIELLLWAMEQTDSPNPIVRERWWEYRSQMEHPPEIEGSSIYRVPFVRCRARASRWSLRRPNTTARGEKQLARRRLPAILSLVVHIVSRGGCLPPRNRRGLPPPLAQ